MPVLARVMGILYPVLIKFSISNIIDKTVYAFRTKDDLIKIAFKSIGTFLNRETPPM
jgi:hypothetical protein